MTRRELVEVGCEKSHHGWDYTEFTFLGARWGTQDAYDISSLEMLVCCYEPI
jgi:hypothetical protein